MAASSGYTLADLNAMQKRQAYADALLGKSTQTRQIANPLQGFAQMAEAAVYGNAARNARFPTAPSGGASFGTQLNNLFRPGRNGGLF